MKKLEEYLTRRLLNSVHDPMTIVRNVTSLNWYILNNFSPSLYDLSGLERFYLWDLYSGSLGKEFMDLVKNKPDTKFDDFINMWVETNRDNG